MTPQPTLTLARARAFQQDVLDAGARYRNGTRSSRQDPGSILIRAATADDRSSLERLAALDSADTPTGPTLIGELLARPVAALSLSDGSVVADPFVATEDVRALLRLRARQLEAGGRVPFVKRLIGRGLPSTRSSMQLEPRRL